MRVFTLLEIEKYFSILTYITRKRDNIFEGMVKNKQAVLLLKYNNYIEYLTKDINRKERILYILRRFSSYDNTYKIKDYSIIGDYDDIVIRLKEIPENKLPTFI